MRRKLARGGPMRWADHQGTYNLVHVMKKFGANPRDDAGFSQPATLLGRLAAECKSFA